jgi:poly(3-hydroxybutyrate) depolymerase
MVETMAIDNGIDRRRVFVTGLSAGGAMTSVMLACYPEVFAGGAILPGCRTARRQPFSRHMKA